MDLSLPVVPPLDWAQGTPAGPVGFAGVVDMRVGCVLRLALVCCALCVCVCAFGCDCGHVSWCVCVRVYVRVRVRVCFCVDRVM